MSKVICPEPGSQLTIGSVTTALIDHPGCVHCMENGTPVRPGEVCPKCGDRLPTDSELMMTGQILALRSSNTALQARLSAPTSLPLTEEQIANLRTELREIKNFLEGHYDQEKWDELCDQALAAIALERQLNALKRGEFVCSKCELRKDSEHEYGDF